MKKTLVTLALLGSVNANASISGNEFVNCFRKALKERIAEIKKERPDIKICDGLTNAEVARFNQLYGKVYADGKFRFYSERAMGIEDVRFHYDRVKYEFECYERPSNIFSDFVISFGSAIGAHDQTNLDLTVQVMSKMLGRDMWTENGSDLFNEHNFDYCKK